MTPIQDNQSLINQLQKLEDRLASLESRVSSMESQFSPVIEDKMALFLTVPDTIRKSLFAVSQLEKCTAEDVSEITGRHRSIENKYLNELVRSGWLEKKREGKKMHYYLKKTAGKTGSEYHTALDELETKLDELLG